MAQGEIIYNENFVTDLLRRIMENRALLTVTIPGERGTYNSAILQVAPSEGYLVLDELKPIGGHHKLVEARALNARTTVRGVEIRFSSTLQEAGTEDGIALYRMSYPEEVSYLQRRAHFRVTVALNSALAVELQPPEGQSMACRIVDISEGGLGIQLPSPNDLNPGKVIPCEIRLPPDVRLRCELEIRHSRPAGGGEGVQVGCRFVDLPSHQRKQIARLITDIQREMIRTLPRDQK